MLRSVFRLLARLALVATAVYLARMALQRWVDGPEPEPASPKDRWAQVTDAPRSTPPANPTIEAAPPVRTEPVVQEAPPAQVSRPAQEPEKSGDQAPEWVAPDTSGAAPSTHPVKVKLSSRIYREPGASGYDRTRPDRCYISVEAAEADGFVRAKR